MKNKKNNLDERQEQIMLQIEHTACWLCYILLLASILIQELIYHGDMRYVAGEWITFMVLCIYILARCLRNGLWDRHIQPNLKNNVVASLIAGGVLFVFTFLMIYRNFPDKIVGALAAGAFTGIGVFVLCLIALSLAARATKKRQEELEKEDPEEDEE